MVKKTSARVVKQDDVSARLRLGTAVLIDAISRAQYFSLLYLSGPKTNDPVDYVGKIPALACTLDSWEKCARDFPADLIDHYGVAYIESCRIDKRFAPPRFFESLSGSEAPSYHIAAYQWLRSKLIHFSYCAGSRRDGATYQEFLRELGLAAEWDLGGRRTAFDSNGFAQQWQHINPLIAQLVKAFARLPDDTIPLINMEGLLARGITPPPSTTDRISEEVRFQIKLFKSGVTSSKDIAKACNEHFKTPGVHSPQSVAQNLKRARDRGELTGQPPSIGRPPGKKTSPDSK